MINVCVPVLRRYDLLRNLLRSLCSSTTVPRVFIIDNGRNRGLLDEACSDVPLDITVERPGIPMGVAESWNWFIKRVPEERVISNDDIVFASDSLERLVATDAELAWAGYGFACYLIRDSCVQKIGLFDETISPGYGYYEDEDYLQRLDGRGTRERSANAAVVECGIQHFNSGTLKAASHEEILEHHRRFKIAQANYSKKWGVVFQ